jgi:hypothetical protein
MSEIQRQTELHLFDENCHRKVDIISNKNIKFKFETYSSFSLASVAITEL